MQGNVIIDLQYGSTGKGLIAGFLAERDAPDTLATAWAANAGHTYIDKQGVKYIHTMLANGVVSRRLKRILIGPGSLIQPDDLLRELQEAQAKAGLDLNHVDILIHPNACVITQEHRDLEQGPMTKIGSTKKGVGEAAIQRIRRDPDNMNVAYAALPGKHPLGAFVVTAAEYQNALDATHRIQIEGAQGYSLSMYHGFYPYCTSRDVSTHQVLADCAIPVRMARNVEVIGTVRSFPIRVANRFDEGGNQVGFSGPCYPDQHELDWERDLGRKAELTTVTKLPRRIFTFSPTQLLEAVRMCGAQTLFLNFVNYCPTKADAVSLIDNVERTVSPELACVGYVGMGPTESDVLDLTSDSNPAALDSFLSRYYRAPVSA
jgi:adenylosuccinate synthase